MVGCSRQAPPENESSPVSPSRLAPDAILVAVEGEPRTLVPSVGGRPGGSGDQLFELVHQSLVTYDDRGKVVPRVARDVPSLDGGTWVVRPDGTMETTWRLRDDVVWQDGRALTADDVVFSWRVFNEPAVPVASRRVARLIESVESLDERTVLMRWRTRYAFADQLTGTELTLLPSHLLEATFDLRREQFAGHSYWRSQFIGLGPFRLQRWPPGSSIELVAFDRYFLGKPLLSQISVRFIPDDNAAMAGALTGSLDMLLPRRAVHGVVQTVRERWRDGTEGTLSMLPDYSWLYLSPQFLAPQPEELADLRVRQALIHSLDRESLAEVVTGDRSMAAELLVPSSDSRYARLAEKVSRYPYDPRRAADLFREVGWRRGGAEDVLVRQGRRLEIELAMTSDWERVGAAVSEYWQQAGIVVRESVFALSAVTDRQNRSLYSGVEVAGGSPNLALLDGRLNSANAPKPENQWVGPNRGHYSSPTLDALLERIQVSLDREERAEAEREIARQISIDLPIMGLFFYPAMALTRRSVDGVRPPLTVSTVGRLSMGWNAHEWRRA